MNVMMHDDADDKGRYPGRTAVRIATADDMRGFGREVARATQGGDVLLLSGPLGAGKTTFAQGFGSGLGIDEPIVSPTFTIARELDGRFADGSHAHLVHVDAYRLGGHDFAPGQNTVDALLDELESLGLDEELEDPQDNTVILMEWGEQMIAALAQERLEIRIDRPVPEPHHAGDTAMASDTAEASDALTEDGERLVILNPVGARWQDRRLPGLRGV